DRTTREAAHGEAATAGERDEGSRRRPVGRRDSSSYASRSPVAPLPSTLAIPPPVSAHHSEASAYFDLVWLLLKHLCRAYFDCCLEVCGSRFDYLKKKLTSRFRFEGHFVWDLFLVLCFRDGQLVPSKMIYVQSVPPRNTCTTLGTGHVIYLLG
uniref:Uncharacterized protein n=1 Tax=Aegilops tauschii subsp. strangulata TaxID=200361 RepID=A0A453SLV7_AEGTS